MSFVVLAHGLAPAACAAALRWRRRAHMGRSNCTGRCTEFYSRTIFTMQAAALAWITTMIGVISFIPTSFSGSSPSQGSRTANAVEAVRTVLQTPEDRIDLATAKLTFDKLVDPTIDIEASLGQINRMVESVKSIAGPAASSKQKLTAVRDYIYLSGAWNDHRPYQYDLADPRGEKSPTSCCPTISRAGTATALRCRSCTSSLQSAWACA